jgi:hypothetical protein
VSAAALATSRPVPSSTVTHLDMLGFVSGAQTAPARGGDRERRTRSPTGTMTGARARLRARCPGSAGAIDSGNSR